MGWAVACNEVEMSKVVQYHSALHDSDNRYHVYSDCPQGNNIIKIIKRCTCDKPQPIRCCEWCDAKRS